MVRTPDSNSRRSTSRAIVVLPEPESPVNHTTAAWWPWRASRSSRGMFRPSQVTLGETSRASTAAAASAERSRRAARPATSSTLWAAPRIMPAATVALEYGSMSTKAPVGLFVR